MKLHALMVVVVSNGYLLTALSEPDDKAPHQRIATTRAEMLGHVEDILAAHEALDGDAIDKLTGGEK